MLLLILRSTMDILLVPLLLFVLAAFITMADDVGPPAIDPRIAMFDRILENVIGFDNVGDCNCIIQGGMSMLDRLKNIKEKALRDTIDAFEKRPTAATRVFFGMEKTNLMIGLLYYVQDCNRIGDDYVEEDITVEMLEECTRRNDVRKDMIDSEDTHTKTSSPGQFKDEANWVPWHDQLEVYLGGIMGIAGVPLTYVIRAKEEPDPGTVFDSFIDEQVARAPLQGANFQADARKVHNLILSFVGGLRAEQWIKDLKPLNNGRRDILALRNHYSGAGNVTRQITRADQIRDSVHYRNERLLSFEKFLNKCQEMFNIYSEQDQPWTERQKVQFLLGKNRVQAANLVAAISALTVEFHRRVGTERPLTFVEAANQLSLLVTSTNEGTRSINALKTGGAKGKDGKDGPKKAGKEVKFGTWLQRGDVFYRKKGDDIIVKGIGSLRYCRDWKRRNPEFHNKIRDLRDMFELPGGNRNRSVAAAGVVPANINVGGNASAVSSVNGVTVDQLAEMISQRMVSASRASPSMSEVTDLDRPGNAGDSFGGRAEAARRRLASCQSSQRRLAQRLYQVAKVVARQIIDGRCDFDSHADTCVVGKNFTVVERTGRVCDVSAFSDEFGRHSNVEIVSAATLIQDEVSGLASILIVNEALSFPEMDYTLLNPNQIRYAGNDVWDNPFDPSHPLSMVVHSDEHPTLTLPITAKGTILSFPSRTPTQQELDTLPHYHLTLVNEWDPHNVRLSAVRVSAIRATDNRIEGHDDDYDLSFYADLADEEFELLDVSDVFSPKYFSSRLASEVIVHSHPVDLPNARGFQSSKRHSAVTAEDLSNLWGIGLDTAKKTLAATTQRGVRSAELPLSRRYRTDRHYRKPLLHGRFYCDTLFGRHKSLNGNTCAQVFANKSFFVVAYPMDTKAKAGAALREFISEFGVPELLTFDGSREQMGKNTEFMKTVKRHDIDYHISEPYQPNQNAAEGVIREARKRWFRTMRQKAVPRRLWDFGFRWVCDIMNRTVNDVYSLHGRTPLEHVTGETPDISEWLDCAFYDFVWYRDNAGLAEVQIGRWLGVSHHVGPAMSFWILTRTCAVISRTTVQRVTNLERQTEENKNLMQQFDADVNPRLNDEAHLLHGLGLDEPGGWRMLPFPEDHEFAQEHEAAIADDVVRDADEDFTPEVYDDNYLNMEVALPTGAGDDVRAGRVTKRMRDASGNPVGTAHDNPMLDTRLYEVTFVDGSTQALSANAIALNMFAQVDDEGRRHLLLKEISDHRKGTDAVLVADAMATTKSGTQHRRHTTKGWDLLVEWKDGSSNWLPLKDLKESYPVEIAEYSVANRISEEPAFAWWVPYVLRKRNCIISKVKQSRSKYLQRTHKFGFRIPKSVEEARQIDEENGNNLWWEAILKEMKNVRPAFEVWEKKEADIPVGYQRIRCHMIFDVKLGENFRCKARFVAGGHTTETPSSITYSSVVSRDSVRIALLVAALNDLDLKACDIQNAYLTADCRERIYTIAGPEFGSERGSLMIIKKALYGLKSSGAAFRALLADTLHGMGFRSTRADPDVYLRKAVKPDGFEYYEMMLCYVDDILCLSHNVKPCMEQLQEVFTIKDGKIEEPEIYLGAKLEKKNMNGINCWTMTSDQYVNTAVKNLEERLLKMSPQALPTKCPTPLASGYRPEIDVTPELTAEGIQQYQELIGILRWACELGRVDILHEVSIMSSHLALPRKGHLLAVYHIFGYLKQHPKRTLAFDPSYPSIDESRFKQVDWQDFYRDAKEKIPADAPTPLGNYVTTHCFVDADHATDRATRRSHTGFLIFVNRAPIIWYSKRQQSVEASTFGSEFMAMKTAVEHIQALRYKLRMFGIPIADPTSVMCDNNAVVLNASIPESRLAKKHNSVAYHLVREAVASETIRVAKEHTSTNLADPLTKTMPSTQLNDLFFKWMY
jgi:Reverse transcriptase (RNA-dependent DNA polymerase)